MNPCGRGFLYEPRLNKTGAYFSAFSMVFFLVARLAGRPLPPLPPLGAVGSRHTQSQGFAETFLENCVSATRFPNPTSGIC